jgi:hypothetical protein
MRAAVVLGGHGLGVPAGAPDFLAPSQSSVSTFNKLKSVRAARYITTAQN